MCWPPRWMLFSGLRACTSNSRGALATCSSTNSGSRIDLLAVDLLAGGAKGLERLVEQELDPDLGDDPPPAAIEDRHRVLAEDLVAGHRVDEHSGTSHGWLDKGNRRAPCYPQWNYSSSRRGTGLPRERAESGHPVDRPCRRDARSPARERRADDACAISPRPPTCPRAPHRGSSRRSSATASSTRPASAASSSPARRSCASPIAAASSATSSSWPSPRSRRVGPGQRRDGQPLGPHPLRRRPPRPGRRPPLPRRRPVGRAPRRIPLHRQRQGLPRLRRGRDPPRAAGAADDGDGRQPRRARAGPRARAPRRLRHRRRRARGRPERTRRARPAGRPARSSPRSASRAPRCA